MSSLALPLGIIAAWFCQCAMSDMRWREILLEQAHTRIESWYTDPSLMEAPKTRDGITVSIMKQDMQCGGDAVPVTFAEFDVVGARPVDIFNTMLDTSAQKDWNNQCSGAASLGEWQDQGARAWAVNFQIPFLSSREFFQWQVADAKFDSEEFWLVFSTQNNEELHQKSTISKGTVDSQNCLGGYHITKIANGAHVIITQQVNVHPMFAFPLHQILDFFPPAWQGTLNFVNQMSSAARLRAANVSSKYATVAPAFMLREVSTDTALPSVSGLRLVDRAEAFPKVEPKAVAQARVSPLQTVALILLVPSFFICVASIGFGTGHCAARRIEEASIDLENEALCVEESSRE